MKTLIDLFNVIDEYYEYLMSKGQQFTEDGWPLIDKKCFQEDVPDTMVPFYRRTEKPIRQFSSVAICSFCPDKEIYPRLGKVLTDIKEYKKYVAVVATDLTVTDDMDIEWQKIIMLVNQLFMAILAVNGIKVIANTRTGNAQSLEALKHIPKSVMYASGFLGCGHAEEFDHNFVAKILYLRPSTLLIYGKCAPSEREQLSRMGIRFKVYDDFQTFNKKWRKKYVG